MEQIYFHEQVSGTEVMISDKVLRIGQKTFVSDQITTVEVKKSVTRKNVLFYFLLVCFGSYIALQTSIFTFVLSDVVRQAGFGVALVSLVLIWLTGRKQTHFTLRIGSASGVEDVFRSNESHTAMLLLERINAALASREQEKTLE
ncbi:hypothetical protein CIG75_15560 [Tumebacillus algifaecis]|uniref:Uncharacterized protein n=1 Tax=Tumebacillus algifaecis TaxID=1214604 RepID=A0A223D441_9BACL|nr:DUF6232 family protein [Tumebacillus algifaecis]ASS76217.1 hypothetical protein CIG75_15560 [Tumebacillus algifaecis]